METGVPVTHSQALPKAYLVTLVHEALSAEAQTSTTR